MRWTTKVAIGSLGLTIACQTPEAAPAPVAPVAAEKELAAEKTPTRVAGIVAERLDASSYTYLRLTTNAADEWVAVPKTGIPIGTAVTLTDAIVMQGFESKTLNRRFERIYFGNLTGQGGGLPAGHPPVAGSADVARADVKVDKAEGASARTVAEVWAQKQSLTGTKVVVRGTVVKLTEGVLGKNWLHLRDGSGSEASGDHDLTVTSSTGSAAIGEVVTIEGVVGVGKDFGAGYAYPVIVEEAVFRR